MPSEVGSPVARCPRGTGILNLKVLRKPVSGAPFEAMVLIEKLADPFGGTSWGARCVVDTAKDVELLPPGKYKVSVYPARVKGWLFETKDAVEVEVKEQARATAELPIHPGSMVHVRLFRGAGVRRERWNVRVFDANGAELVTRESVALEGGLLSIQIPFSEIDKAKFIHVKPLAGSTPLKEGYLLEIANPPDFSKVSTLSRALRAIGIYPGLPVAESLQLTDEKMEAVNLQLGLAEAQVARGDAIAGFDATSGEAFEGRYREYEFRPRELSRITFDDRIEPTDRKVRVKLFRGAAARDVRCIVKIVGDAGGSGRAPELAVTDATTAHGVLEFTIPKAVVPNARAAYVIFDGAKEGLVLKLGPNPSPSDGRDMSMLLRSLGFWTREPLDQGTAVAVPQGAALAATDVGALALNTALMDFQLASGQSPAGFHEGTAMFSLPDAVSAYDYRPRTLAAPDFST